VLIVGGRGRGTVNAGVLLQLDSHWGLLFGQLEGLAQLAEVAGMSMIVVIVQVSLATVKIVMTVMAFVTVMTVIIMMISVVISVMIFMMAATCQVVVWAPRVWRLGGGRGRGTC